MAFKSARDEMHINFGSSADVIRLVFNEADDEELDKLLNRAEDASNEQDTDEFQRLLQQIGARTLALIEKEFSSSFPAEWAKTKYEEDEEERQRGLMASVESAFEARFEREDAA